MMPDHRPLRQRGPTLAGTLPPQPFGLSVAQGDDQSLVRPFWRRGATLVRQRYCACARDIAMSPVQLEIRRISGVLPGYVATGMMPRAAAA